MVQSTRRRQATPHHEQVVQQVVHQLTAQVKAFTGRLEERRERVQRIRQCGGEGAAPELREAADEVSAQYEELLVINEELRVHIEAIHEANTRVASERRRWQALFASSPLAYVTTDRAGIIREANTAAARLLGATARRLAGKPIVGMVAPRDRRRLRDALSALSGHESVEAAVQIARPRDAPFPVVLSAASDDEGSRVFLTIQRRTTEGDASARLVAELRDLLRHERAVRTHLESTDRAKDRFLAVLSHDLRGPIHAVLGWVELLRSGSFGLEVRERAFAAIERCTHAELALVEELLDLSRIAADKMVLERAPSDLDALVRQCVEALTPLASKAKVALRCEVQETGLTVFVDLKRMTQVITNLLANALKFTKKGGHVCVRVQRDGQHAAFEVEDDGDGIPSQLLPELFDCYRQGAATRKGCQGLGLGLYIVRQLVNLHGGNVEARSEGLGHGSTFVVRLPRCEATAKAAPALAAVHDASPRLNGIRVLVVEDELDARELLSTVLGGLGAKVAAASDAETAMAIFDKCSPDVLVSDIGLPGVDGYALVRSVRDRSPGLRAIAVSGFAATSDIARSLEAGFDLHLVKPLETSALVAAIRHLTSHAAVQAASGGARARATRRTQRVARES